jgi:hypothetical protein
MTDARLRLCSHEERGVWFDLMCLMHLSREYGVLRQPIEDIARAVGAPKDVLEDLVRKGVLRGRSADSLPTDELFHLSGLPLVYAPSHAGRKGQEVVLLEEQEGHIWFSDKMLIARHKQDNASSRAKMTGKRVRLPNQVQPESKGQVVLGHFPRAEDRAAQVEAAAADDRHPRCPYEEIAAAFKSVFPMAPRPRSVASTTTIGRAILKQWRRLAHEAPSEYTGYASADEGLEKWQAILAKAGESRFLRGDVAPTGNHSQFEITLDWLMETKQIDRVMNGFYHRGSASQASPVASSIKASVDAVQEIMKRRSAEQMQATRSDGASTGQGSLL